MRRKWIIAVIVIVAAWIFAACGGGILDEAQDDGYEVVAVEPTPSPVVAEPVEEVDEYEPQGHEDYDYDVFTLSHGEHGYIAVSYIEFINDNLYARVPFSYRELEAALWLVDEFLAMGYDEAYIEIQEFSKGEDGDAGQWVRHSRDTDAGQWIMGGSEPRYYSQNVILTVPGQSERKIIVGAHYDTLPYPGASDNASGMALLLESAQRMLNEENYYTIVYVFFGAEEVGLVGAHVFVESLSDEQSDLIEFMVNADVLFEGPYLMYGVGRGRGVITSEFTDYVSEIALGVQERHGVELFTRPELVFAGSDHLPFKWAGHYVVVLFGMDKREDGSWMTRVLHSPYDDFHHINEQWPGKIGRNMRYFSIFLEDMLLSRFD